jgi:hypothetical protein
MRRPNPFTIKIENQGWLCNDDNDDQDLCSHGEIFLSVLDTIITQSSVNEEWGISESALALLRTLENDYCCEPEHDEGLILHGCGAILMMGCPISIHWSVKHLDGHVTLSDFVKITTTNPDTGSIYYPGLEVKIGSIDYKNQIVSFALQAKELFNYSKEKRISDDYDKELYEEFWTEYNQLLIRNMNL